MDRFWYVLRRNFTKVVLPPRVSGARKVDVRPPGKENSNSHGARPVHLIITMIKWFRTSRLSIKNSLSGHVAALNPKPPGFRRHLKPLEHAACVQCRRDHACLQRIGRMRHASDVTKPSAASAVGTCKTVKSRIWPWLRVKVIKLFHFRSAVDASSDPRHERVGHTPEAFQQQA